MFTLHEEFIQRMLFAPRSADRHGAVADELAAHFQGEFLRPSWAAMDGVEDDLTVHFAAVLLPERCDLFEFGGTDGSHQDSFTVMYRSSGGLLSRCTLALGLGQAISIQSIFSALPTPRISRGSWEER